MASILRNDDAEALILDIRVARTAVNEVVSEAGGAILVFPTSIVTPGPEGGQLVFPLVTEAEPGVTATTDGTAAVSGTVGGVTVRGTFQWVLAGDGPAVPISPATYQFQRRGREVAAPAWATQLPASRCLLRLPQKSLDRHRLRVLRRGRAAEHWLMALTERVVRQFCRGPVHRAIRRRPPVDVDDVVQRGMQAACRLLPVYASPARPPCSWLGMLKLDSRRDLHREVSRLDWLPADAAAVVALARSSGIGLHADASVTIAALDDVAAQLGRSRPRMAARQVEAALRAPSLVSLDGLPAGQLEASVARPCLALAALDDQAGRAAAAVARLVTDDPELVALAVLGDPRALTEVGQHVVVTLARAGEARVITRRRCWDEFQRSGQLFATDEAQRQFASRADIGTLAAIDAALRHAAGLGDMAHDA